MPTGIPRKKGESDAAYTKRVEALMHARKPPKKVLPRLVVDAAGNRTPVIVRDRKPSTLEDNLRAALAAEQEKNRRLRRRLHLISELVNASNLNPKDLKDPDNL